jgi:hypothetical protein
MSSQESWPQVVVDLLNIMVAEDYRQDAFVWLNESVPHYEESTSLSRPFIAQLLLIIQHVTLWPEGTRAEKQPQLYAWSQTHTQAAVTMNRKTYEEVKGFMGAIAPSRAYNPALLSSMNEF